MFTEFLKDHSGKGSSETAFKYLVTDLLRDDLTGSDKQREIEGIDMESVAPTSFVPTFFYIFMYGGNESAIVGNKTFHDAVPLIYCTAMDRKTVTGINFNYMPNSVRAAFMDFLGMGDNDEYMKAAENGKFVLNKKLTNAVISPDKLKMVFAMFRQKTGIDLTECLRTYDRKFIIKSRMIEFDMYKYIPLLSFHDAVRGASLAKIQLSLLKNK